MLLYNAAAIIAPEGIRGTYRKLHLGSPPWVTEGISFRPGNALPVWETRYGPVGVLTCYDFWLNPELSRLLAFEGAPHRQLLRLSSYAGSGLVESAREACYLGHSTIAGPAFPRFSHVYAEAGDAGEIVSATLSFEKLHRWDAIYPWRSTPGANGAAATRMRPPT